MCSAVWNGCSLQCQHTVKLPHPSHLEPFSQKCLLEQKASPWGAPNVTNQMWTEKHINTMETTWTQLVPALNKNVYPATKPIVWGLNEPAVFLFNVIVSASMWVSGFVCCMMARSDKMTFCANSENFPQGDGTIHTHIHTHTHSKRPICTHTHTCTCKH